MADHQVVNNRNHRGDTAGTAAGDAESEHDLAARIQERQNRPASIDMALNLERELDDEHEQEQDHNHDRDASTSIEAFHHGGRSTGGTDGPITTTSASFSSLESNKDRRVSLDPQVLQHIITNLRSELSCAQSERDALAEALAGAPTREAELREALELLTEKSAKNETELEGLRRKSQDDEDNIQMLRTKLEESRRALMRLQTESKRMSQMSHMSVDVSRANSLFGGGPSSSKRASFTPLTGSGAMRVQSHRRISSISEPSFAFDQEPSSPMGAGHATSWPGDGENDANAKKARRSSAFFGGMPMSMALARSTTPSPPTHQRHLAPENGIHLDQTLHELDTLKKERNAVRSELASTRQELAEAQEAREASEQCVAALRSFIAAQADSSPGDENASGILKLPPLPTEKNVDESATVSQTASNKKAGRPVMGAGWSFGKLFRAESNSSTSATWGSPPTEAVNQPPGDIQTNVTVTGPSSSHASHSPSPSTATPGGAFSRTFGGFFSARAPSITSIGSVTSPNGNTEASNAQSNKNTTKVKATVPPTAHGQQEPTMNGLGSDEEDGAEESIESSTTGPVSPDASRASREEIWIRNVEDSEVGVGVGVGVGKREGLSSSAVAPPALKGQEKKTDEGEAESVQLC